MEYWEYSGSRVTQSHSGRIVFTITSPGNRTVLETVPSVAKDPKRQALHNA